MPDLLPDFRSGDALVAEVINELVRRGYLDIRCGQGLNARRSASNQIQLSRTNSGLYIFKGKVTSGGISARSSDSAHGSGSVEIWVKNPSTGAYADSGVSQAVDYISSTTGGLSSGTWVNCAFQEDGTGDIVSVDCAN